MSSDFCGINYDNFLVIISSPSGAGKSTICKMITQNDDNIKLSVSVTTRKQRHGEIDGTDYYFISQEEFERYEKEGLFLEHATVFGNSYGTLKSVVADEIKLGNEILFDVDWQGARQIKENYDSEKVITIFILPPSIEELEARLYSRAQDSLEVVAKRMSHAHEEISHYNEYDYVVVNKDLEDSYTMIRSIINAERVRRISKIELEKFVNTLL